MCCLCAYVYFSTRHPFVLVMLNEKCLCVHGVFCVCDSFTMTVLYLYICILPSRGQWSKVKQDISEEGLSEGTHPRKYLVKFHQIPLISMLYMKRSVNLIILTLTLKAVVINSCVTKCLKKSTWVK